MPGATCHGSCLELQKLPVTADSSRHQGELGALGSRSWGRDDMEVALGHRTFLGLLEPVGAGVTPVLGFVVRPDAHFTLLP